MKVAAITLARAIGYIELWDMNPSGKALYPDGVRALIQRYGFQKFPSKFEELDESKGVEFLAGKYGDTAIDKLVLYNTGVLVETRASTGFSHDVIEGLLLWAKKDLGLTYEPRMIKRWAYVSGLTFYTDFPILDEISTPLQNLSRSVTSSLAETAGEEIRYEPVVVTLGLDILTRKYPYAGFSIQRRAEAPFSENKYFSESPLRTDRHIALLEQLEADVIASLPQAVRKR